MTLENAADASRAVSQYNPLLAAATPLLNAIVQIRQAATHDDPTGLRQQLVDEINLFEARCRQSGLPFDTIIGARYCLCSVLDEAAAQTPWGTRGIWSGNGLLVTFHNESWGGEKVFQLLSRLSGSPAQHLWLLEIIHYCLLLGYEGRYRGYEQGRLQRDELRDRLAQLILETRRVPGYIVEIKPPDQDVEDARWRPPVSLWLYFVMGVLMAVLIYSGFNWCLSNEAQPLLRAIGQMPLPEATANNRPGSGRLIAPRIDDPIVEKP